MVLATYLVVSVGLCGFWLFTVLTWLRWLSHANGHRPFIQITVWIGWICLFASTCAVVIPMLGPPESAWQYIGGFAMRVSLSLIGVLMWVLHARLHTLHAIQRRSQAHE